MYFNGIPFPGFFNVREYSFTNRDRAVSMRQVLVSHMEQRLIQETKKRAVG